MASNLTTLLAELVAARIELVVVGGLAAVAQGAPITTMDLDVVHRRTESNVDSIVAFLVRLHARYRGRPGGAPLPIDRTGLLGPGHSLFMTDLGPLDLLGVIEEGLDYDRLLPRSRPAEIVGHTVHVLDLAEIVRLKRASTHPKDKAMLPILEETLRRRDTAGGVDPAFEQRMNAAAARGSSSLRAGTDLGEILRVFREEDNLGPIGSMLALRAIKNISLAAAKHLVSAECAGESFAHLGLAELEHLVRIPTSSKIQRWLPTHLQSAIIDGRPWRLFERDEPGSVRCFDAATSDPSRAGSMFGSEISLDWVREEARTALAVPGWCDEVRVVRDEPDVLLVHFPLVRERP